MKIPLLRVLSSASNILVGGQAVIEGVMMRVPGAYATAVRDPQGDIQIKRKDFVAITERSPFWKKPILRGMASLFEAMKIGMGTLQWSADIAIPLEEGEKEPGKISNFLTTVFSIALAILLFMIAPMWITTKLLMIEKEALCLIWFQGDFAFYFLLYISGSFLLSRMCGDYFNIMALNTELCIILNQAKSSRLKMPNLFQRNIHDVAPAFYSLFFYQRF